jgi:hypothetical protein
MIWSFAAHLLALLLALLTQRRIERAKDREMALASPLGDWLRGTLDRVRPSRLSGPVPATFLIRRDL